MATMQRRKVLVCNCRQTMRIDGGQLASALDLDAAPDVHTELCRSQIQSFQDAVGHKAGATGAGWQVCCTQEAPLFAEIAGDMGADANGIAFTNIREQAGWCAEPDAALPKMAALIAAAAYDAKPAGLLTLNSSGICLVYGAGQQALEVAQTLSSHLSVNLLLSDPDDAIPPDSADFPIYKGRIRNLSGNLGAFNVVIDEWAAALPFSRAGFEFAMARDGARSECDVVVDLSGGPALLSEPQRRDGYVRADPGQPALVAKAMLAASEMVGEFEKPLYVTYDGAICAHSRSGKVGCRNCLDACPMSAITPDGDHVKIDHYVCAGCGNCGAVCPTGAVSHVLPAREDIVGRARVMLDVYGRAGGQAPVLLIHCESHGTGLISAMARFGRGLPANVLPLKVGATTAIGHETLAALLASGATRIVCAVDPRRADELEGLEGQIALLRHILDELQLDGERVQIAVEADPDALETLLWEQTALEPIAAQRFMADGTKRELARLALSALHEASPSSVDIIALPQGAPYGQIEVDTNACTLCLACVGACPADALSDNPERPELAFTEAACVQCGVCVATCPENAISLDPRYDFTSAPLSPSVLKSEEPFACISCGKPFGAKSSIERVVARLKGHAMFTNEDQLRLIQMCDVCRVTAVAREGGDPYTLGERPRIRTTDDYKAAEEKAALRPGSRLEDFLDD